MEHQDKKLEVWKEAIPRMNEEDLEFILDFPECFEPHRQEGPDGCFILRRYNHHRVPVVYISYNQVDISYKQSEISA